MDPIHLENCDKKVEVILRSIHPNMNPPVQEGPNYSKL